MRPFTQYRGIAAPLQRANVDTDMIIRIERLMLVPRAQLGTYAFEMIRNAADGSPDANCILNRAPWNAASILVTGRNFGCGSSRETAVWAVEGMGIRAIIAPSFGDIFRENCIKNGILPVILDEAICERISEELLDSAHGVEIEIDLEALQVRAPSGSVFPFVIGDFERQQLLTGEDEIASTLHLKDRIVTHLKQWSAEEPWSRINFRQGENGLVLSRNNTDDGKTPL